MLPLNTLRLINFLHQNWLLQATSL